MKNLFTKHPESIGETYWQHLLFASCLGLTLIVLGIIGVIHAIFPFLFEFTVSRYLYNLNKTAVFRWEKMNEERARRQGKDRSNDF